MKRFLAMASVVALGALALAPGPLPILPAAYAAAKDLAPARAALAKGAYAEAASLYTQLLQSGALSGEDLALAYHERGIAQQKNGYVSHAVSDYTNALWLDALPKGVRAKTKINRGVAFLELGQLTRAINDFDSAIQQDPRLAEAYFGRATAKRLNGDAQAALADYERALALGHPRPELIHYGRGLAFEILGNRAAEIAELTQAANLAANFAAPRERLAIIGADVPPLGPGASATLQATEITVADARNAVLAPGAAEEATGALDTQVIGAPPLTSAQASAQAEEGSTTETNPAAPPAGTPRPPLRPSAEGPLGVRAEVDQDLQLTAPPAPLSAGAEAASAATVPASEGSGPAGAAPASQHLASVATVAAPGAAPSAAGAGGFRVQVAAYFEKSIADKGLADFTEKFPAIAQNTPPAIETAEIPGKGTVYRLRIGPFATADAAAQGCAALKAEGQDCVVVPPARTAAR